MRDNIFLYFFQRDELLETEIHFNDEYRLQSTFFRNKILKILESWKYYLMNFYIIKTEFEGKCFYS